MRRQAYLRILVTIGGLFLSKVVPSQAGGVFASATSIECSQVFQSVLVTESIPTPEKLDSRIVYIVDAYGSGTQIAQTLRDELQDPNLKIIHIRTQEVTPFYRSSFDPESFQQEIVLSDKQAVQAMEKLRPRAIFAGSETGVPVAAQLARKFKVQHRLEPWDAADLRSKHRMQQRIASQGLQSIPFFYTDRADQALSWNQNRKPFQQRWPLVVKPDNGIGGTNVYLARNERDLRQIFEENLKNMNALGFSMDKLLVQEFIPGPEFSLQFVFLDGHPVISDIWEYLKTPLQGQPRTLPFYDLDTLVSPQDPRVQKLIEYSLKSAKALGIKNGPAHFEVKLYNNETPILVEVGGRPYGGGSQALSEKATGRNQVKLMVMAAFRPQEFLKLSRDYQLQQHGMIVQFRSEKQGFFRRKAFEEISGLPSVFKLSLNPHFQDGDVIVPTTDLDNTPGLVQLLSSDPEKLKQDAETIRNFMIHHRFLKP